MNGELAQAVCLAGHGSSWLAGTGDSVPPALDQENTTFQFVGSLQFHLQAGPTLGESTATTVRDWLLQLRDRGVDRIWLWVPEPKPVTTSGPPMEEHMMAGFANAGRWGLVATGERHAEVWRPFWQVGDREAPESRIWSVRYEGSSTGPVSPPHVDLDRATTRLTAALEAALAFAERHALRTWAGWFERALAVSDEIPFYPDLLPPGYSHEARRLAAMGAQAWVFGGMGSWNDLGFEDESAAAEYEAVSRNLYNAVLVGVEASVDSAFEPPVGPFAGKRP